MGFFSNLFHRKKRTIGKEENEIIDDHIVLNRENLKIHDREERTRYVESCLDQIQDASRELRNLKKEYNIVTSYLTDIEEIEALPKDLHVDLYNTAMHLKKLNDAREGYLKSDNRMTDLEFEQVQQMESDVEDGVQKLQDTEKYMKLIKSDLKRLDNERHAYKYRYRELENDLANYKGMAMISFVTMLICILVLFGLQAFLRLNTRLGYVVAVCGVALVMIILFVKYNEADAEINHLDHATNKLILLQNTVKIRYVNNKNLMDYLCLKFHTVGAQDLNALWSKYLVEKAEREKYENATKDYAIYQEDLLKQLKRTRVKDPTLWLHQVSALLDQKEMVEVRHHLVQRRQSLRSQIDYNQNIAEMAQKEIKELVNKYEQYADEIMHMVGLKKDVE